MSLLLASFKNRGLPQVLLVEILLSNNAYLKPTPLVNMMFLDSRSFFSLIFFFLASSSTIFAAITNADQDYSPKNTAQLSPHKTPQRDTDVGPWKDSNTEHVSHHYYGLVSGGYGNFEGVLTNDGQTGILRLALGTQFNISRFTLLGAEIGIQTGARMRVITSDAIVAIGSAPVFLTVKPPIDVLLAVSSHLGATALTVHAKAGVAYNQGLIDSMTIPNKSQVVPEVQLGLGYEFSRNVSLVAYYQRFFGNMPLLTHIDINNGTASLNHLPTLQAGFVGIQRSF